MTALAEARDTKKMESDLIVGLLVKGSTKIYKGSLVVINAGYAAPGSTATGLVTAGRAKKTVDNSSGSNGDESIEVERGIFRWANGDGIAQTDVGVMAYVVDDQTVSKSATGKSPAGKIVAVDSYGVWVACSPIGDVAASRNTQTGSLTLVAGTKTISTGITITANSKVLLNMTAPGAGALGDHYKVTDMTVGAPGVGAFTVTAISSTDGSTIATDISVHDFVIVD